MIDGKSFFDQPVKGDMRTYDRIRKIATDQEDDYTTCCLLDYNYFNNYYEMIAIDLSKQQEFDADPKAIQQLNFTGNLDQVEDATNFFIIEEAKETVFHFSQGTVKVLFCTFTLFYIRWLSIDEARNYLIEEVNQNELMSKKHKKICTTLNYIEHSVILASTVTGCLYISGFSSLFGIPIGITSSAI